MNVFKILGIPLHQVAFVARKQESYLRLDNEHVHYLKYVARRKKQGAMKDYIEFCICFIQEILQNRELYDHSMSEYSNRRVTDSYFLI